jgi:AraC-like DNA-binding protein
MFYFFGIGLNLFLLVLLISKRGKSTADKILAGWLFIIGCHLALYILSIQRTTIENVHLLGLGIPFPFLHGPFLYLYTAAITNMLPKNRKLPWVHFLPAAILVLYLMPVFLMGTQQKMELYIDRGSEYKYFFIIQGILMQLSGLVYVAWSFILLRKHKKNIGQQFSYEERINLNWLRYLIYALLGVWAIIIFVKEDAYIFGAAVIFVTLIGFFGIKQVGIFNNIPAAKRAMQENPDVIAIKGMTPNEINNQKNEALSNNSIPALNGQEATSVAIEEFEPDSAAVKRKKYANSGLTKEMLNALHLRLCQLMADEKLYVEPELSLSSLAARLNIHPNYLSQTINEMEGKSFFDYVNMLRLEEFKRLMRIPGNSQFTIMSLAYDCGFNSKSSFNKNFKKLTGQSPSEYFHRQVNSEDE